MDATEAFMIEFDPSRITYEEILDEWADQHAPYYPSSKCQYRSAIWFGNEDQHEKAKNKIEQLSKGGERKVYVDLEPITTFYKAEEYHQNFLEKQTSARSPMF